MVEAELDNIKTKLKDDNFDLQECEKKLLKIEKKLLQLENKFNNTDKNTDKNIISGNNLFKNCQNSDSDLSSDSDCDINIDKILRELAKLESEITNINTNISIEKLIDNYIEFKTKLENVRIKNDDFKLKIEYL
jgi:hypothetical protein